jgi:uncharacterized membrane protein YvlD (DUF360 family)
MGGTDVLGGNSMRLIARLLLTALAFTSILPMIGGIDFHGNYWNALLLAVVFGLMLWIVDIIAVAISAIAAVGTLGAALLVLVPLWLLGFWLLPAVALKLVSDVAPNYLSIEGWLPAILGGLVMMGISMLTSRTVPTSTRAR